MTLKTFSDKAKTFTFTYEFKDLDTALVAGHALLGYMTAFGTLKMLGDESISLLQKMDVEGEYKGLAGYSGQ